VLRLGCPWVVTANTSLPCAKQIVERYSTIVKAACLPVTNLIPNWARLMKSSPIAKKMDGVPVRTKQVVKVESKDGSWAIQQVLTFDSVTFKDVDVALFTPPPAVRDLLENKE
jgi:hypothetical protein